VGLALEAELLSANAVKERAPLLRSEHQCWSLRVLAVTYRNDVGQVARDLHALTAVTAAIGRLTPHGACHIRHVSSATFMIRSVDAPGETASLLSVS